MITFNSDGNINTGGHAPGETVRSRQRRRRQLRLPSSPQPLRRWNSVTRCPPVLLVAQQPDHDPCGVPLKVIDKFMSLLRGSCVLLKIASVFGPV